MKKLALSFALLFVSCDQEQAPTAILRMPNGNLSVYTVIIDGNEYYATRVHHGWTLCPKLPRKQ